ncbi:MAG TPA: hypothetical protein VN642_04455 [Dongiaceae bacterium]|nr:hypothetical protein [Dongiaceae bacterium]
MILFHTSVRRMAASLLGRPPAGSGYILDILPVFGNTFCAKVPDPIAFNTQNRDSGAEYRPVIFFECFSKIIKEKKGRQITDMAETASMLNSGGHAGKT